MSTLAEIEAAAKALPVNEQSELVRKLMHHIRRSGYSPCRVNSLRKKCRSGSTRMNARGTRFGNCSASEKREAVSRHERPARRVSIGQRRFAFHRHCRGSERLDVALQSICHTRGESQSPGPAPDLPRAARADWPGIESRLTLVEDTYPKSKNRNHGLRGFSGTCTQYVRHPLGKLVFALSAAQLPPSA